MFDVEYIDNHIVVVCKKAAIPTQKSPSSKVSLEEVLKEHLKRELEKESVFLHPLHRLDRGVLGLVIFAKSSKALSRLNEEFRERRVKKGYRAYVEGRLQKKEGILEHFHRKGSYKAFISPKDYKRGGGKVVSLKYRVLGEEGERSLVEIELITGRYHQIRAQFGYIGNPIVGDRKYGSSKDSDKISLVCSFLEFFHPVTKRRMVFRRDFLLADKKVNIFLK